MMMENSKSNLDEMQEQQLLEIEHNGCWLAFWGLVIAMVVQRAAFGSLDFRNIAGEWAVFMVLALYLAIACMRRGIWDRRIPMNAKANVLLSAIAALAIGALNAVTIFRNYQNPGGAAAAALIIAVITFALCFVALTVTMKRTAARKAKLEAEPSDTNEM